MFLPDPRGLSLVRLTAFSGKALRGLLRSIINLHKFQPVSRGQTRRQLLACASLLQSPQQGIPGASSLRNCHLHEDQPANHAIQERIAGYIELPALPRLNLMPLCHRYRADRSGFLDRCGSESPEVVLATDDGGNLRKNLRIEGRPDSPGKALAERIANMPAKEAVPVAPGDRIETGVKGGINRFDVFHRQLHWQPGIQCIAQGFRTMCPFEVDSGNLSRGMNAGIRT